MVFAHIKSPLPVGFIYQNTDLHSAPPHAGPCFSLKPANRTTLHAVSHQSHLSNLLKKKHPKDSPSSQVVPQDIPYSTSDLSHTVCPKFNSHVYKPKRWAIIDHICSIMQLGSKEALLLGGLPNIASFVFDHKPNNLASYKIYKNKNCEHSLELIM
jgi:hypothetical protein